MAMKTNFPTIAEFTLEFKTCRIKNKLINLWTTQSSLYSQETWGGVWVVIAISSYLKLLDT